MCTHTLLMVYAVEMIRTLSFTSKVGQVGSRMIFLWIFLLVATTLLYILDRRNRNLCKEVPGPDTLPFLGNAHQCVGSASDFFQSTFSTWQEFGNRIRIFIGPRLLLLITDPKDVEVVLSNHEFVNKSKEYKFLHPWLGTGLLTSTGEKWRAHRKMITPAFHFKILENFMHVFDAQTDILLKKLSKNVDRNSFNVYPIMTMYALDVISETAMGVSINAQKNEDSEYVRSVKDMCEVMARRTKNPFKRSDFLFSFTNDYQKQKKALKVLHGFTNQMIHERRKLLHGKEETLESYTNTEDNYGRKKKMAFLDLLLLSKINGQPLNDTDIREEVDTFLFEGHDTTTSALSFTLYLISKYPEVQQKLYDEQKAVLGNDRSRAATYSELQEMKYLELALKEALRLFPSVPILGRETVQDTRINGMFVPKGTSIVVMVFNMNRNPDIFPEPDVFRPERFSSNESGKRNPFSVVSFSAGPRNCIGQKFAMMALKSSISKIIRRFELLPSNEQLELTCDVILKSYSGVFIKLKNRNCE